VNTHCATKEAAVTGLQCVVDGVMHDDRLWLSGLCCMPFRFSLIQLGRQRQLKPPLPDGLL
jgi:hypothetical protein